jgi:glycosyltransferase involved in cell wall biosynthesis
MKQKIIHFIFDLGRGGAETMLVRVIKELPEYDHVVVTLFPLNHWGNELECSRLICFNLKSLFSLPLAIFKLHSVVKREKPAIVHTHLFWPTIIARLSVPKKIPLITTIHAFIKTSIEYKNWHVRFLDKLTYHFRKSSIIGVAKGVTSEYFSLLNLKPYKAYTLYTFVDTARFTATQQQKAASPEFKVVSVGALRMQKNYLWPVRAFAALKEQNITLDIYGVGNMQEEIQQLIDSTGAKVTLKGEVKNIEAIIPQYDLYLMSSTYEGFSLSVLEAMAMGVPLLLSDISSFREQGEDTATYFSLSNEYDLPEKLLTFSKTPTTELQLMGAKGQQRALLYFTLPQHVQGLRNIYAAALNQG